MPLPCRNTCLQLVGVILGIMYGLLLLYVTVQVFILIRERHKKASFKFGFNLLCFLWNLLRVVFWVLMAVPHPDVPPFWIYFLWWLPHAVMYAALLGVCGTGVASHTVVCSRVVCAGMQPLPCCPCSS